jgi:hypothetical protein
MHLGGRRASAEIAVREQEFVPADLATRIAEPQHRECVVGRRRAARRSCQRRAIRECESNDRGRNQEKCDKEHDEEDEHEPVVTAVMLEAATLRIKRHLTVQARRAVRVAVHAVTVAPTGRGDQLRFRYEAMDDIPEEIRGQRTSVTTYEVVVDEAP